MKLISNRITDSFWLHYRNLVRKEMIPYQWKVLNDEIDVCIERERNDASLPNEKSHALENFRIAAGQHSGHHYGWVFQDSDVYKWLEAVAWSLKEKMDEDLLRLADGVVDLIGEAQEEDGYLGTYFTIEAPERKFLCLEQSHELYCAGHFMEAAAAYYPVSKNKKVLDIAEKLTECIRRRLGPEGEFGYDGHEEIEIGLMKLYHLTGKQEYLELARHFLDVRGTDEDFFGDQRKKDPGKRPVIADMSHVPKSYFQAHKPVREQDTAEGHAVRLVYLCTAMADVAAGCGDAGLYEACRRIWRNIVDRRMYITGGVGSTVSGEAFTFDYDLPNDTMYCETCASVGLMFFAREMLKNEPEGEYGDVMERALYNTVLSGTALDGKHFFYVNPLEVTPESSERDPGKSHVKPVRPAWLACACCPPNLARLLASLEQYVYTVLPATAPTFLQDVEAAPAGTEDAPAPEFPQDMEAAPAGTEDATAPTFPQEVEAARRDTGAAADDRPVCLVNLYMSCAAELSLGDRKVLLEQETGYPRTGDIRLRVRGGEGQRWRMGLRIPGWAGDYSLLLNGNPCTSKPERGYVYFEDLSGENVIELRLPMEPELWSADPRVRADIGKVAVGRGPVVYCLEEADNGKNLQLLSLAEDPCFETKEEKNELGDIAVIYAGGKRRLKEEGEGLYHFFREPEAEDCRLRFIPYYTWANRGKGEMTVWVRRRPE